MTSLAHQLKRLALPQNDRDLFSRQQVASLLFAPKDAAAKDKKFFYDLGCTGLDELLGIEPAFLEFKQTLFSRDSLELERSVQSREVNAQLDAGVALFLSRLCPYFLLKPAHKCIEWLVHRFHIHLYNVDSLLACVLPYHDTQMFVRVVQLLRIKDASSRWNWLHCLQKPGVPLSRGTLIGRCTSDPAFLDFMCSLVTRSVQSYAGTSPGSLGACAQLRVIFSFFASTIVAALDAADHVSDVTVAKLLPEIQKGLRSSLADYKASSYMLVCQLAVSASLQQALVDTLAAQLAKSLLREPILAKEGVASLLVLLQGQQEGAVGPRAALRLLQMPALVPTLQRMAKKHDVAPLLRYLLPHLVPRLFLCSSEGGTEASAFLEALLDSVPLPEGLERLLAKSLLASYLDQDLDEASGSSLDGRLQPLLRLLESRYFGALDSVLSEHAVHTHHRQRFHHLLSLTVSGAKHQFLDSETTLILGLRHPEANLRISALEHLGDIIASGNLNMDGAFLKEAVFERLQDDNPSVVMAAIKILETLLEEFEPDDVVTRLQTLLQKANISHSEYWLPPTGEALRILSLPWCDTPDSGWTMLPFLFLSWPRPQHIAGLLARCGPITRLPLTSGWEKELEGMATASSDGDFLGVASQRLLELMKKNFANMEPRQRRDTCERVLQLLEEAESDRGVGSVEGAEFLLKFLIVSLQEVGVTQHLLTASRVLSLMERRLLDNSGAAPQACLQEVLSTLITCLQCPDMSLVKGTSWWNPERMDTNTLCYLNLLLRLFSLLGTRPDLAPLMKLLFQVQLGSAPLPLFHFLSVCWGLPGYQQEVKVDATLTVLTLNAAAAILARQPADIIDRLADAQSPVLPSLLVSLSSPLRDVRVSALLVLRSLSTSSSSPYKPITDRLLNCWEELEADPAYITTVLGSLFSVPRDHLEVLQTLLQCVGTAHCPSYTGSALLRTLAPVGGEEVLTALLPVLQRHLESEDPDSPTPLRSEVELALLVLAKYDQSSAPLLGHNRKCLDLFLRALRSSAQPHTDLLSCQSAALEQVTRGFFASLGDVAVQQEVLSAVFDLLVEDHAPITANAIASLFKRVSVDGELLANQLSPPERPSIGSSVQETRRHRRPTTRKSPEDSGPGSGPGPGPLVPWRRTTRILELLQHKKKIQRVQSLVPVLFTLLGRTVEDSTSCSDDINLEYTKQLLLGALLNICNKLANHSPELLEAELWSVELVVAVVRSSDVPQTHHQALLLLGAAAAAFPDKVLHNMMPIFTFMGANVLRRDDAYSQRVVELTLSTVIPALMKRSCSSGEGPEAPPPAGVVVMATGVLGVFVDALPHIPAHRRRPLLQQLVATLGPAHFLSILLLLLFKQRACGATEVESVGEEEEGAELWLSLCSAFSLEEQLQSLLHLVHFLLCLPLQEGGGPKRKQTEEEELIFSVEKHSGKQRRHFLFLCVTFCSRLLGSSAFIAKVVEEDDEGKQDVSDVSLQQRLLEEVLRLIDVTATNLQNEADKTSVKFWKVLLNKVYEVLDKVNALLPTDTFIAVMSGLLRHELASVRRKAMELLNNKLTQRKEWDNTQVLALLRVTEDLLGVVKADGGEPAVNRQTALYSLKLLCRCFGPAHQEAFQEVLRCALDVAAVAPGGGEERHVVASALLCVAEAVTTLKTLAIPQLPRLMPAVLLALSQQQEALPTDVHLLSAVAALQAATETLPHFLSPYLPDIVLQVCRLTRWAEACPGSTSSSSSQLRPRLNSLCGTIAVAPPPRILLPIFRRCYGRLVEAEDGGRQGAELRALMGLLKQLISHMDGGELSVHQSELSEMFLTALEFRECHSPDELEEAGLVEDAVIDCLVAMVMKLSEVTFRPLFFKLCDWSRSGGGANRLLTFLRLCDVIAHRLKGLFVLFAGNLTTLFVDLLQRGDKVFDSDRKSRLLRCSLLDVLQKLFMYDNGHFLSRNRAEALLEPLVDQVEKGAEPEVSLSLCSCVRSFAAALNSQPELSRKLNHHILLKSRSSDSQVRLSSLRLLQEVTSSLRENFLVLLPETIPFLSELMEDENQEVELKVQEVIQEMEKVLGEPLNTYF